MKCFWRDLAIWTKDKSHAACSTAKTHVLTQHDPLPDRGTHRSMGQAVAMMIGTLMKHQLSSKHGVYL